MIDLNEALLRAIADQFGLKQDAITMSSEGNRPFGYNGKFLNLTSIKDVDGSNFTIDIAFDGILKTYFNSDCVLAHDITRPSAEVVLSVPQISYNLICRIIGHPIHERVTAAKRRYQFDVGRFRFVWFDSKFTISEWNELTQAFTVVGEFADNHMDMDYPEPE